MTGTGLGYLTDVEITKMDVMDAKGVRPGLKDITITLGLKSGLLLNNESSLTLKLYWEKRADKGFDLILNVANIHTVLTHFSKQQ